MDPEEDLCSGQGDDDCRLFSVLRPDPDGWLREWVGTNNAEEVLVTGSEADNFETSCRFGGI